MLLNKTTQRMLQLLIVAIILKMSITIYHVPRIVLTVDVFGITMVDVHYRDNYK